MMILTTIYELYFTVWTSFPVSVSWSSGRRASSRRAFHFAVCESWEGDYLYVGDDVVSQVKRS